MQKPAPDTAAAAMPQVGFGIANAQTGKPVIYVTTDTSKNQLTFTFTYVDGPPATLKGGAPVPEAQITPAGPSSLYMTISAVLSPAEFAALTITPPPGWQARLLTSWVMTPVSDLAIKPGDSFSFTLTGISADGQPGPGSANIDYYNIPGVAASGMQLPLSLENPPDAHKDLASVLTPSVADGNTVFIDIDDLANIPTNTLVLRLTNTSQSDLYPDTKPWPNTPVFFLTFVSANSSPGYGALTTVDRLKDITLSTSGDYGTKWKVEDRRQMDPPHWAIYPRSLEILGTGAAAIAEFRIDNIRTDFAPSSTPLYLQSSGIPGYDDASWALPLEKRAPELAIQDYHPAQNNVPSGTAVELVWKTFDADKCTLSPIGGSTVPVPTQAETGHKVIVGASTAYTLTAHNTKQGTSKSALVMVDVQPVSFATPLTATPAQGSHFGDPVTLTWAVESTTGCTIAPPINGVSEVPAISAGTVIHPVAATNYTLTAQGEGGPIRSSVAVIPVPGGWQSKLGAGLWDTYSHPVILAPFQSQMWFLAGGAEDAQSSVFSTRDGFNWTVQANDAAFTPRGDAAGCVLGPNLWLTGGATRTGAVNEVWSSADGVTWNQSLPSGPIWSPRSGHGCAALGGKIWVFGGMDAGGNLLNDVWNSPDGQTWTPVTTAAIWKARASFGVATYNNQICMVAGKGAGGALQDAWATSDGVNWNGMGITVPWMARSNPCVAVQNGRLYLIGGTGQNGDALGDGYYFDTSGRWNMAVGPGWQVNNLGAAGFLGAMWFAGGGRKGVSNTTVWGFG